MEQNTPEARRTYGTRLPNINLANLKGKLIVLEGADGSGRSTQVKMLKDWLEGHGYPTVEAGLKRSTLVGKDLEKVLQGHTLTPTTFYLYYATDFADELENVIIPALRADFVVLADRYIYTLMARDMVRGANAEWIKNLYSFALVPDAIFNLVVPPPVLAERSLKKYSSLDYWESGMDIRREGSMYDCFIWYQQQVKNVFDGMQAQYGFQSINGNQHPDAVFKELKNRIKPFLNVRTPQGVSA